VTGRLYAFSAFALGLSAVLACGAPPKIDAPKEVPGVKGDFVIVTAVTDGKAVKFVPLTSGLRVFPSSLLNDQKSTVVVALEDGNYRLLAYTGNQDGPSDPVVIVVKIGGGDTPAPDEKEDPVLKDPLFKAASEAFKKLPADQQRKKDTLTAVYKAVGDQINDFDTAGQFFTVISDVTNSRLGGADQLRSVRDLFGAELGKVLPSDPKHRLTPENKAEAFKQLSRFKAVLEAIK
jgi:hypothetical protein